jgi:hypothetical protein
MALLILFFGGLFGVFRRAERGSGALGAAVFVAGSAIAVTTPLAIMLGDHLLLGLAAGADPLIVRASPGSPNRIKFQSLAYSSAGTHSRLSSSVLCLNSLGWATA